MFSRITLLVFVCRFLTSAIRIAILEDADFAPPNTKFKLADLFCVDSQYECACQCFTNSTCLTATHDGVNKTCSLFSASIKRNWLQKMAPIRNTSVLTLANVSLPVYSTHDFQQPPNLYTTGSGPIGMVSADFNQDGHLDLAISNYYGYTMSVLLGIGNGSFQQPAISFASNGNTPYWLVAHDFNHDLNVDLAVCNEGSGTIAIFLGLSNGSFQLPATTFSSGGSVPSSIIAADVNNDTNADLILTNTGSNIITIFLGIGNGTFQVSGTSYTAGSLPSSIASGDFNTDGNIDLAVVSRNSNQLLIFLGVGNGTFQANPSSYTTGTMPYVVRTADFNGDSKLDIVVGNFGSNSISIFIGTGVGTFITSSSATYTTYIAEPIDIAIQDLNDDSIKDLAISNQNGNIAVYFGYGNATFGGVTSYSSAGQTLKAIVAADFNEDGEYDLAVLNQNNNNLAILLAQWS